MCTYYIGVFLSRFANNCVSFMEGIDSIANVRDAEAKAKKKVSDSQIQAEKITRDAKIKAEQIIASAESDAESVHEAAFKAAESEIEKMRKKSLADTEKKLRIIKNTKISEAQKAKILKSSIKEILEK